MTDNLTKLLTALTASYPLPGSQVVTARQLQMTGNPCCLGNCLIELGPTASHLELRWQIYGKWKYLLLHASHDMIHTYLPADLGISPVSPRHPSNHMG